MTTQADTFITDRQIYDAYLLDGTSTVCFRCGEALFQGVQHNCRGYWQVGVGGNYHFQTPTLDRTQASRTQFDKALHSTQIEPPASGLRNLAAWLAALVCAGAMVVLLRRFRR